MFYPCPQLRLYFHDGNGNPLVGGKLKTFISNSTIPIRTVRNAEGTILNPTEITLDERGECTVFLTEGVIYRFELYDSDGALVLEQDGISVASGSGSGGSSTTIAVESGSNGIDVQQTIMDSGVVLYTISAKKIEDAIEAEKNRAESAESALSKSIADETERATKAEKGLSDSIEAEKNRAESAEIALSKSIADETKRATEAEKGLSGSIEAEKNRAEAAESALSESIADKAGTASPLMDGKASVGNSLKYAREDHVHPSDTSKEDKVNKTTVVIGTSDSKYPTDKAVAEFVNSSIATNTANYISNNGEPFTSVAQLEAYSGPVTNNDYAFVTGTDSEGNTYYDRYKATVSGEAVTWALEYRLNNSSFTAAQWSAINSGITSALVAKIHDHSNKDVLDGITSSDVASWNSKQNSLPTSGTASSTYAINISGNSTSANNWRGSIYGIAKSTKTKRYVYIGRKKRSDYGCLIGILTVCSHTDSKDVYVIGSGWSNGNFGNDATVQRISSGRTDAPINICLYNHEITENNTVYSELWCYIPTNSNEVDFIFRTLFNFSGKMTLAASVVNCDKSEFTGTLTKCANSNSRNIAHSPTNTAVGSASVPVYVTNSGSVTACTDDFVHDGDVTSTYSATGTAPVNGTAVAAAIGGLDVSSVGGDGKYISAISETDGKISATATSLATAPVSGSDVAITAGGVYTALAAKQNSLTAGDNITIDGNTISSDQIFVATCGTTTYQEVKAAFNSGKICTVLYESRYFYVNRIDSTNILFVSSNGGDEMYWLSLGSGNSWSFRLGKLQSKLTFDTSPKAGSTNPVTSNGIKTAIDTVNAKGLTIKEISGEQVICFE